MTAKSQPGLKVGQKVPDAVIAKIVNDKQTHARLSDYKDQLLIVDFWDTQCSGCIAAMPRLEALQKKFGKAIKILPVTTEPAARIREFLATNKYTRDLNLSSVVEDKTLGKMFRYKVLSHEAWIYKGKLVALTEVDYVDSTNIQFILDGHVNNWPVKDDLLPGIDYSKPFLQVDNKQYTERNEPLRYTAFFGYRPNEYSVLGVAYDSVRHTRRNYFVNYPVLMAYYLHWAKLRPGADIFPDKNRVVLEVSDPTRFAGADERKGYSAAIHREILFCYEAVSPDKGETEQEQAMSVIKDLDYFLGLHGRYEKRKMKCLVLTKTVPSLNLAPPAVMKRDEKEGLVRIAHNLTLDGFVRGLNAYKTIPPVINETGYNGESYMELNIGAYDNIPALRQALQGYGMDLKEEEREIEVFVLTETSTKK